MKHHDKWPLGNAIARQPGLLGRICRALTGLPYAVEKRVPDAQMTMRSCVATVSTQPKLEFSAAFNSQVWLQPMLASYALLHAPPRPNRSTCTLVVGGSPGRLTRGHAASSASAPPRPMEIDDLASSTSEQAPGMLDTILGLQPGCTGLQTQDCSLDARNAA